jgi:hypothetical protein
VKSVSVILGYRQRCYMCGAPIRRVYMPAISDRWQWAEDFDGAPEIIELHDCPEHPAKRNGSTD